jgi:hypothetical protein
VFRFPADDAITIPSPAVSGSHSSAQLNAAAVGVPDGVILITSRSPAATLVEVELLHVVFAPLIVHVVELSVPFLLSAIT